MDCLLPYFDRTTAGKVVKFLTGQVTDVPGAEKKVLLDGREMRRNPKFDNEELWDAWRATPTPPAASARRPPRRELLQFATEFDVDGVRPGACVEGEWTAHAAALEAPPALMVATTSPLLVGPSI